MPLAQITKGESTVLNNHYAKFSESSSKLACTAIAAGFLVLSALVVLTCTLLCLYLPGVNVIKHVILPGVLPASLALLQSIPFIYLTVKRSPEKDALRATHMKELRALIAKYKVAEMKEEEAGEFIAKELMPHDPSNDYKMKVINDLKAPYKDKKHPLFKRFDKAIEKLYEKKK